MKPSNINPEQLSYAQNGRLLSIYNNLVYMGRAKPEIFVVPELQKTEEPIPTAGNVVNLNEERIKRRGEAATQTAYELSAKEQMLQEARNNVEAA